MSDYLNSIASTINYKYTNDLGMFQIGGISSGLDTASIIEQILKVESRPLEQLTEKYKKLELMRKAFQDIDAKLEELRDLVFDFKLQKNVIIKSAESSNEQIIHAEAYPVANPGTYYIKVVQMATSSTLSGFLTVRPSIDTSSTTFGDLDFYTTPVDSVIRIYDKNSGDYREITISTSDTIDDVVSKLSSAIDDIFGSGSADVVFDTSTGKLSIGTNDDTKQIVLTQVSGNFLKVFHLDEDSPVGAATNKIESTAPVWAVNPELKTLQDIANYNGTTVSEGNVKINGVEISINTSDTLEVILEKINSSDANVYAYYDYHQNRIVLRRKDYGNKAITVEDDGNILQTLGLVSEGANNPIFIAGQSAHLQISTNGVDYVDLYADQNEGIVYEGVSLSIRSASDDVIIVRVGIDKEAIKDKLREFVDKWNEVVGYIYEKLNEEPVKDKNPDEMTDEDKMKGVLKNDPYLRSVFERLRSFMTMEVNPDGDFHYLFEIGISSGDIGAGYENMMKGILTLDEEKIDEIINNNLEELWKFLGESDESFMSKLYSFLWDLTKFGGEIDSIAGINGRLYKEQRVLSEQIANWIDRLHKREIELWRKFSYMEEVISRLQAQSAWISQAFSQNK